MRDHPQHDVRVLGGMWGGIGGKLPGMAALIERWGKYAQKGEDGRFMSEVVFPLMAEGYLCHDNFGHFDDARPFPPHAPMVGTSHVGEVVPIDQPRIDALGRGNALAERLGSQEGSEIYLQEYSRLANELMLADEECARLRPGHDPGSLSLLHRLLRAIRRLPAAFSIRRRLSRS